MTLARYQGTGLAEVTTPPGMRRTPRWWRQLSGSRYCPRCLARSHRIVELSQSAVSMRAS